MTKGHCATSASAGVFVPSGREEEGGLLGMNPPQSPVLSAELTGRYESRRWWAIDRAHSMLCRLGMRREQRNGRRRQRHPSGPRRDEAEGEQILTADDYPPVAKLARRCVAVERSHWLRPGLAVVGRQLRVFLARPQAGRRVASIGTRRAGGASSHRGAHVGLPWRAKASRAR